MRSKKWKSVVAFLCIFVIVVYTSVIFLPHLHDCGGSDCAVCALIETSRNTIVGLALAAAIYQSANIAVAILTSYKHVPLLNDGTPVALKVKLSD